MVRKEEVVLLEDQHRPRVVIALPRRELTKLAFAGQAQACLPHALQIARCNGDENKPRTQQPGLDRPPMQRDPEGAPSIFSPSELLA